MRETVSLQPSSPPVMNSLEQNAGGGATNAVVVDELLEWELRVAQRADELAPKTAHGRDEDLRYWLQAEREIFVHLEDVPPLAPASPRPCGAIGLH